MYNNNVLIIGLAIPFVVVILAAVLGIYLKKKKPTAKEEPEMEKNKNYGIDDEYHDEHDNVVEDKIITNKCLLTNFNCILIVLAISLL